jgi:hypothetical protein
MLICEGCSTWANAVDADTVTTAITATNPKTFLKTINLFISSPSCHAQPKSKECSNS